MIYYIIDFDSTLVRSEGMEELAKIVLEDNENKQEIISKIKNITDQGMEGKITFRESLTKRIEMLSADKSHIKKLGLIMTSHISESVKRNISFFRKNTDNIYIISGGFKDFIMPTAKYLGVKESRILANDFIYKNNRIIGFDLDNPLSGDRGKVKMLEKINLSGEVVVIGDGWTDYEMRAAGLAQRFYAYCENVKREKVCAAADRVVYDFEEIVKSG